MGLRFREKKLDQRKDQKKWIIGGNLEVCQISEKVKLLVCNLLNSVLCDLLHTKTKEGFKEFWEG